MANIRVRTPELDAKIAEMFKSGINKTKISWELRISIGTVVSALKDGGIEWRTPTKKLNITKQQIREMKVSGMSYRQIAKVAGVSGQRIQAILLPKNHEIDKSAVCSVCGRRNPLRRMRFSGERQFFRFKRRNSLSNHHPDYKLDETIPVCNRCHGTFNRGKKYKTK